MRRTQALSHRPGRSVSVPVGTPFAGSPPRYGSEASFSVTIARSSRTGASSATGSLAAASGEVLLPLTLFEYGFPARQSRPLPESKVFTDPREEEFMRSEAGTHLRTMERTYTRTLYQYVSRSVPLSGINMLVLGSGSSMGVAKALQRGVTTCTFVDVSQLALDALRTSLEAAGVLAAVDASFVCVDAWEFLEDILEPAFDLIIMVKCAGLVLSSRPQSSTAQLLDLLVDALLPGGDLIVDQHEAFSTPEWKGRPIAVGMPEPLYNLATICGRYARDVGYSWDLEHPDVFRVSQYRPFSSSHLVQTWRVIHMRARHGERPPLARVVSSRVQKAPPTVPLPPLTPFDGTVDVMIPVNHKGVKRVPHHSDLSSFDRQKARPKMDGVPGVMVVDGSTALFLSPTRSATVTLPCTVQPPLVLTAELVESFEGGSAYFVTGAIMVGTARTDPNDFASLQPLVPLLDRLLPASILPNTPDLLRDVVGDVVRLSGVGGRLRSFPVDGISVSVRGVSAHFIKPLRFSTVDALSADAPTLIERSSVSLGIDPLPVEQAPSAGVWEYALAADGSSWRPTRERTDKTWSDSFGATIHSVTAAYRARTVDIGTTVEEVIRKVLI